VLADELEEPVRVCRLTDDLEAGALEQARKTFAQEYVVVCDDDSSALIRRRFERP